MVAKSSAKQKTTPVSIRRAQTQEWRLTYEGHIPYSHGIGGNIEPGGVLSDSGLPFCVVGVRTGDILVIEGPPTPLSEDTDCSDYQQEKESETAYRITEAYQYRMVFEPMVNPDNKEYPVPTEECFPFAVSFYARAAGAWTVVGTKTGGMAEVVDEGRNGHLCRVGDTNCMAGFAVSLLGNPEKLAAYRKAARDSVLERFSQEEVVDSYESYYEEVLAG